MMPLRILEGNQSLIEAILIFSQSSNPNVEKKENIKSPSLVLDKEKRTQVNHKPNDKIKKKKTNLTINPLQEGN